MRHFYFIDDVIYTPYFLTCKGHGSFINLDAAVEVLSVLCRVGCGFGRNMIVTRMQAKEQPKTGVGGR